MRAWLEMGDSALAIPREGLWIGRSPDCDLVVDDHRISQVHALLTWRGDRLELIELGRNPTHVNEEAVSGRRTLVDGDRVVVPGGCWTIAIPGGAHWESWVAILPSGQRLGLGFRTLGLGGAMTDDVRVEGWPAGTLTLHRSPHGGLLAEANRPLDLAGEAVSAGTLEALVPGTEIRCGDVGVVFVALAGERPATTLVSHDAHLPIGVAFRFTPTGGELALRFAGTSAERLVDLPELRARLVAVLLARPDEEIEDDDVLGAVWPGHSERTRLDLNQLVHRARKDLLKCGVDPTPILLRPRRGGAIRFAVAPGAQVSVR